MKTRKFFFLILICIISGVAIFLTYKFNIQKNIKYSSNYNNIKRIILDSFYPKEKTEIFKFDKPVYRVNSYLDTAYFLTETNTINKITNCKNSGVLKLNDNRQYWYFSISPFRNLLFDIDKNAIYNSQKNAWDIFSTKVVGMQEINDSMLLLQSISKRASFLNTYNIVTKQTTRVFDLLLNFKISDTALLNESQSLSEGMICKNAKNAYFLFFKAGAIVEYKIKSNSFSFFNTIDSSFFPKMITKEIPWNGKILTLNTFENENFLNYSITASNKYLYVLSNISNEKNCNYIDIYDVSTHKYTGSIKMLKDRTNSEAFEIKLVSNNLYILYNNENLYCKQLPY